ncbi:Phenylalanine/histidine ammonia-lyase [Leifsonia rubra CMS 76R]|nr:Phenylalanine/histidine ammonia-lyase [Leifsonia rubra CMS 76R]
MESTDTLVSDELNPADDRLAVLPALAQAQEAQAEEAQAEFPVLVPIIPIMAPLLIAGPEELSVEAMLDIVDGHPLKLQHSLLDQLRATRDAALLALESDEPVYGVNTGVGAFSEVRVNYSDRAGFQNALMLAHSVGSAPWLEKKEARAVIVVRLRNFLSGEAAVSPELCERLVDILNLDLYPAIPRKRSGSAGEIIPLAHLGAAITRSGEFIVDDLILPADKVLSSVGLDCFDLGTKEGVAMIEGIPVTTALAILNVRDTRVIADQALTIAAAGLRLIGASRDPYSAATARADTELVTVLGALRGLLGRETPSRSLQAPLSFRIIGVVLAQLLRTVQGVEDAIGRALGGVTDSPVFIEGRFVGTVGFDGFDLAASFDALRVSLIHLAETSNARLHRMMNGQITGLAQQLSEEPGLHTGFTIVHKRSVGVIHELLARAMPVSVGAIETSLGQEDVQSFSVGAAVSSAEAIESVRDVLSCELLVVIQGVRLGAGSLVSDDKLAPLLHEISDALPSGTADRPFGKEIATINSLLADGWARGLLSKTLETSHA